MHGGQRRRVGQRRGWKKGSFGRNKADLRVSADGALVPFRRAGPGPGKALGAAEGPGRAAGLTDPQELAGRVIFHRVSAQPLAKASCPTGH